MIELLMKQMFDRQHTQTHLYWLFFSVNLVQTLTSDQLDLFTSLENSRRQTSSSSFIWTYYCVLLYITVYYCILLFITVYYCILLYI